MAVDARCLCPSRSCNSSGETPFLTAATANVSRSASAVTRPSNPALVATFLITR